ncbi:hypothetical protein PG995_008513 [Apiospora arundinis]|uniref:Secreted protein n=1 Tax=Apiospora arundinis TaxID=335852 RepID=A0ABR2JNU3_9PEZI
MLLVTHTMCVLMCWIAIDFEKKKGDAPLIDICIRFYDIADFFLLTYPQTCSACGVLKGGEEHHPHTIVSGISRTYSLYQG